MSLQADLAAALLDPAHPGPAGLQTWNGSPPATRLAVHRNNVLSGLVDALAETFPVVQALVGPEFFRAMAALFVRTSPPRSAVLVRYGGGLPGFIAGFAPAASLPCLADVARLEWARVQACHAADAPPLGREALAGLMACCPDPARLQLAVHPSVQVLDSAHAVVSVWAAHQGQVDLAGVDSGAPESALVLRPQWEVLVLATPPGTTALVQALALGLDLGPAAAQAAMAHPHFALDRSLALLMAQGALAHPSPTGSPTP